MQPDQRTIERTRTREIDEGLRNHLNRIYARMSAGVMVTAVTAWLVASSEVLLQLFLGGPQAYIVMAAPLAIVWLGFRPDRMSSGKLMAAFFALSVVYGISFSAIAAYAAADAAFGVSVAKAFLVATSMFAGLSVFGYTTKKDLSGMQTFLGMSILGLVALSFLNLALGNSALGNAIAGAGIVLFSGVTVWQTQAMKMMYNPNLNAEVASRLSWAAALNLYISFIAMFQYILHFMNQR
jgi:hypothetical protein